MDSEQSFTTNRTRETQRPRDGVLRVRREVLDECLKHHTLDELNALPYERRLELAEEAARAIAARERAGAGNDAAAQIRADRERRKAEAWAKRQPKGAQP